MHDKPKIRYDILPAYEGRSRVPAGQLVFVNDVLIKKFVGADPAKTFQEALAYVHSLPAYRD